MFNNPVAFETEYVFEIKQWKCLEWQWPKDDEQTRQNAYAAHIGIFPHLSVICLMTHEHKVYKFLHYMEYLQWSIWRLNILVTLQITLK